MSKEYYWVPENAMFDDAGKACEFMDLGAGTLVANGARYDDLKAKLNKAIKALEKIESANPLVGYAFDPRFQNESLQKELGMRRKLASETLKEIKEGAE